MTHLRSTIGECRIGGGGGGGKWKSKTERQMNEKVKEANK